MVVEKIVEINSLDRFIEKLQKIKKEKWWSIFVKVWWYEDISFKLIEESDLWFKNDEVKNEEQRAYLDIIWDIY